MSEFFPYIAAGVVAARIFVPMLLIKVLDRE
jgi:hypothetical protein